MGERSALPMLVFAGMFAFPSWLCAVSFVALLVGCVGTVDSLHSVEGEAPNNAECEVKVTTTGTSKVLAQDKVRGKFSVVYVASGPSPSNVDIAANCNGVKVRELNGVAPRPNATIDLGKLAL